MLDEPGLRGTRRGLATGGDADVSQPPAVLWCAQRDSNP